MFTSRDKQQYSFLLSSSFQSLRHFQTTSKNEFTCDSQTTMTQFSNLSFPRTRSSYAILKSPSLTLAFQMSIDVLQLPSTAEILKRDSSFSNFSHSVTDDL
ncbi:hypothetical protein A2U01_0033367 [Trifolium medium]|uniref:Uncharacterized protein n=1 Tax=Trifolium medium TaxID=97028 RepID=A0A392PKC1_9FABA|nr:hypothetical protein [Trifolium medium]